MISRQIMDNKIQEFKLKLPVKYNYPQIESTILQFQLNQKVIAGVNKLFMFSSYESTEATVNLNVQTNGLADWKVFPVTPSY